MFSVISPSIASATNLSIPSTHLVEVRQESEIKLTTASKVGADDNTVVATDPLWEGLRQRRRKQSG